MPPLCLSLLILLTLMLRLCQAAEFQQCFWREVFTVDVVAPGASLSTAAHTKNECILHCLQLEDCKTSAFHQHSATCWLYRHLVEYTTTGMASNGTRYLWRLSPSCPGELGYQLETGICFKVYTSQVDWTTAQATCQNDNGTLLIADTPEKRNAVLATATSRMWLGASDKDTEGQWRWFDGTRLPSNNWFPGEPSNSWGVEHFLQLVETGQFNDMPDDVFYPSVCQIPLQ